MHEVTPLPPTIFEGGRGSYHCGMDEWFRSLPSAWLDGCELRVFEVARAAYDSPGRHYHSWTHVEDCVAKLRAMACESPRNVFLALLFHDAVYVPGRGDNEELSAEMATATLAWFSTIPEDDRALIHRMILATRHHRAAATEPHDLRVMLDIDMSILGADEARYRRYADEVRREYVPAVTDEKRFRIGRLAFLRKLAASKAIFSTAEGAQLWDAPARGNIAWEIEHLESQQGVLERAAGLAARAFGKTPG